MGCIAPPNVAPSAAYPEEAVMSRVTMLPPVSFAPTCIVPRPTPAALTLAMAPVPAHDKRTRPAGDRCNRANHSAGGGIRWKLSYSRPPDLASAYFTATFVAAPIAG